MSGLHLGDDVLGAAMVAVALVALLLLRVYCPRLPGSRPRHRRQWEQPPAHRSSAFGPDRAGDFAAAQQINAVMAASFTRKKLLSRSEYRAFRSIEEGLAASHRGYRVFAQTSLGEILDSSSVDAFRSINAKRTDMLIVDSGGWPVLAVEYQGSGHYQGTAVARDTIKREALRKAGVGYLEIFESDGDDEIRARLRQHLDGTTATAAATATSPR